MSTKIMQGKLWSIAPNNWSKYFEPSFLPMYHDVLQQLRLNAADSVLDDGCGSGLFTSLAVRTGASVTGVDAASGLLEVARRRNPTTSFLEEDLEALPFANDTFSVVTAFNSLQYAGSFENALAEAVRVLAPGGRLVIGIWDKPEASEAVHVLKAIGSLLPPPPPGAPGPFALSEDGRIEAACKAAGVNVIYKKAVACPQVYRGVDEGVKSYMGTGPAAIALNQNPRELVESKIAEALQPFRTVDDLYFLQNSFLVFIAQK